MNVTLGICPGYKETLRSVKQIKLLDASQECIQGESDDTSDVDGLW